MNSVPRCIAIIRSVQNWGDFKSLVVWPETKHIVVFLTAPSTRTLVWGCLIIDAANLFRIIIGSQKMAQKNCLVQSTGRLQAVFPSLMPPSKKSGSFWTSRKIRDSLGIIVPIRPLSSEYINPIQRFNDCEPPSIYIYKCIVNNMYIYIYTHAYIHISKFIYGLVWYGICRSPKRPSHAKPQPRPPPRGKRLPPLAGLA